VGRDKSVYVLTSLPGERSGVPFPAGIAQNIPQNIPTPKTCQTALEPTQFRKFFPLGKGGRSVWLTTELCLVPRLRVRRAAFYSPYTPSAFITRDV
jgi:hypothetical protein